MQRVLEYLREQRRTFGGSPFIRFLHDTRFSPQDRLSFLPCLAPFVLGFADLNRALQGEEASARTELAHESEHWTRYLEALRTLELSNATDFAGMLQLLWGTDGSLTRRTLYELIAQATGASPTKSQVLMMALHAVGSVTLEALDGVARTFEARTGNALTSIRFLHAQIEQSTWGANTVELDLLPEQEQDALKSIDEVIHLLGELSDQLLACAQRRLEVKRAQSTWEPPSLLTFQEFGATRIQSLCKAVGYNAEETEVVKRFFHFMSSPWGSRRIGTTPPWKSDITDDHTPFELSLAIEDGRPEVRFLMEAQSSQPGPTTLRTTWEDGLALNERLSQEFGVRLERFEQVKDLFEPVDPHARFALWHAFFVKNGRPDVKIYLNPSAQGPENAKAVVREALMRLGFSGAWRCLSEKVVRCDEKDRLIYFSLDLSAHRAARVKIYYAHQDTSAEELEAVMSLAREYIPGESWVFCQALKGHTGRFEKARAALTCLAFTSDDDERPSSVTLHVPVRCFTGNDEETLERIRYLQEPRTHVVLSQAVHTLAHRPLDAGTGLIQWASMRRQGGKVRTTFYLATEAYGVPTARFVAPTLSQTVLSEVRSNEQRLNA